MAHFLLILRKASVHDGINQDSDCSEGVRGRSGGQTRSRRRKSCRAREIDGVPRTECSPDGRSRTRTSSAEEFIMTLASHSFPP